MPFQHWPELTTGETIFWVLVLAGIYVVFLNPRKKK